MKTKRTYFQLPRNEMVTYLPASYQYVLEIGCGEGVFFENVNEGVEYWGVELDPEAAKIASKKMYRVLTGKAEEVLSQLPLGYFDLIICNDVIEHMIDYDFFFQEIKKHLQPSGVLVGSIPNMRYWKCLFELLVFKDWKYRDHGVMDKTHLHFFTLKSLKNIFKEYSFEIQKIGGINGPKSIFTKTVGCAFVLLTLGFYADIMPVQFGFRLKSKIPT